MSSHPLPTNRVAPPPLLYCASSSSVTRPPRESRELPPQHVFESLVDEGLPSSPPSTKALPSATAHQATSTSPSVLERSSSQSTGISPCQSRPAAETPAPHSSAKASDKLQQPASLSLAQVAVGPCLCRLSLYAAAQFIDCRKVALFCCLLSISLFLITTSPFRRPSAG